MTELRTFPLLYESTLDYFDGVIEFSALSEDGSKRYVATCIGEETPAKEFAATPITEEEFYLHLEARKDLRSIMLANGGESWYYLTVDDKGNILATQYDGSIEESGHLPAQG